MKFTSSISLQEMQNIRRKVIAHQYSKWKTLIIIVRITVLLLTIIFTLVSIFIEPTVNNVLLSILFACYFGFTDLRMQFILGDRRIVRMMKRVNSSKVVINYELNDNVLTKETVLDNKNTVSEIELINLYNFIIHENLILFSKTKLITNFKKSQLIFITLDGLNNDDKDKLLDLISINCVN